MSAKFEKNKQVSCKLYHIENSTSFKLYHSQRLEGKLLRQGSSLTTSAGYSTLCSCCLMSMVNSYGHVGTVSLHNNTIPGQA